MLPLELYCMIFSYLDAKTLGRCTLLCSALLKLSNALLYSNPPNLILLKKLLDSARRKRMAWNRHIDFPGDHVTSVQTTDMSGKMSQITDDFMLELMHHLPNIVSCKLVNCYLLTPISISAILSARLRIIHIDSLSLESTIAGIRLCAKIKPMELKIISIFPVSFKLPVVAQILTLAKPKCSNMDNIEFVDFGKIKNLTLENINLNLVDLWPANTNLVRLELNGIKVSNLLLKKIAHSSELIRLSLTDTLIDSLGIDYLLESSSAQSLEWLKLSQSPYILLSDLKKLRRKFVPNLSILDVSRNPQLPREDVMRLLNKPLHHLLSMCI
jgi:hypothetical protein